MPTLLWTPLVSWFIILFLVMYITIYFFVPEMLCFGVACTFAHGARSSLYRSLLRANVLLLDTTAIHPIPSLCRDAA